MIFFIITKFIFILSNGKISDKSAFAIDQAETKTEKARVKPVRRGAWRHLASERTSPYCDRTYQESGKCFTGKNGIEVAC